MTETELHRSFIFALCGINKLDERIVDANYAHNEANDDDGTIEADLKAMLKCQKLNSCFSVHLLLGQLIAFDPEIEVGGPDEGEQRAGDVTAAKYVSVSHLH